MLLQSFGPKRNNDSKYEIRNNGELDNVYKKPTVNESLESTRISWAGHVWRSEGMIGSITKWKSDTKKPRGRPRDYSLDRDGWIEYKKT
jgi:hypothetical protein